MNYTILAGDGVHYHVKQGDHSCFWSSFHNFETAKATYNKCVRNGLQQSLTLPATPNERFIVYRGAKPGIYNGCQKFVSKGLGWRGGTYERFESQKDANTAFMSYKRDRARQAQIDLIKQVLEDSEKERKNRDVASEEEESKTGDALANFDKELDAQWASLTDEEWAALLQTERE
ncbi:hypothetical protein K435DRAFT_808696 [Dendrothele bispora CBS 962.96]|uniref:Uncharacterized protein n=1 Tax=Dendrothele bispora (strain CBS 962.96) TaxID=1314807 RepID=A0A4S8L0L7_DENBC|nr:hypothetical protein K435DRAFT_808696 [Dendrothele bispora CBS 962.96]